jgi:hypothetical protein
MENKFLALLKSRKFWAAVLGVLAVFLTDLLGMDAEMAELITQAIMAIVGTYIIGTALEDGLSNR